MPRKDVQGSMLNSIKLVMAKLGIPTWSWKAPDCSEDWDWCTLYLNSSSTTNLHSSSLWTGLIRHKEFSFAQAQALSHICLSIVYAWFCRDSIVIVPMTLLKWDGQLEVHYTCGTTKISAWSNAFQIGDNALSSIHLPWIHPTSFGAFSSRQHP